MSKYKKERERENTYVKKLIKNINHFFFFINFKKNNKEFGIKYFFLSFQLNEMQLKHIYLLNKQLLIESSQLKKKKKKKFKS